MILKTHNNCKENTTAARTAHKNQACSNYKHYLLKMTEENKQPLSSVPFPRSKNLGINSKDELSTCCDIKRYQIRRVTAAIIVL